MKNKYKHIVFFLCLALFCCTVNAQEEFNKFENQNNISIISVNKKMFDMMASVKMDTSNKENQAYINLIKKLSSLKVYTTKSDKWSSEMKKTTENYAKNKGLDELMSISDKNSNVKIYAKTGTTESTIKQLLMFSNGSDEKEAIIFILTGDFNLNEIYILTDRMDLPGSENFKNASNK